MTDHYKAAENWLELAEDHWSGEDSYDPNDPELSRELHTEARREATFYAQMAQVHATLAAESRNA